MNVLTDLGAMGWELVSVSWEVDVHGRATPFGGSTNTYSTQYMPFKRPWKDDAQASHVQQRAQWLVRNVSGLMMERACELAEYALEEGIPTWMLPEIAPTFLTREEREKEKRMTPTERMQKMREERLRGRQL